MDKISLFMRYSLLQAGLRYDDVEQSRKIIKSYGNYQLAIENMFLNFQRGADYATRSRSTV